MAGRWCWMGRMAPLKQTAGRPLWTSQGWCQGPSEGQSMFSLRPWRYLRQQPAGRLTLLKAWGQLWPGATWTIWEEVVCRKAQCHGFSQLLPLRGWCSCLCVHLHPGKQVAWQEHQPHIPCLTLQQANLQIAGEETNCCVLGTILI